MQSTHVSSRLLVSYGVLGFVLGPSATIVCKEQNGPKPKVCTAFYFNFHPLGFCIVFGKLQIVCPQNIENIRKCSFPWIYAKDWFYTE